MKDDDGSRREHARELAELLRVPANVAAAHPGLAEVHATRLGYHVCSESGEKHFRAQGQQIRQDVQTDIKHGN